MAFFKLPVPDKPAISPARSNSFRSGLARSGALLPISRNSEHDIQWYILVEPKADTWHG